MTHLNILIPILGKENLQLLQEKNLKSVFDFLLILPKHYSDQDEYVRHISKVNVEDYVYVEGKVLSCIVKDQRYIVCRIEDDTGKLKAILFSFNTYRLYGLLNHIKLAQYNNEKLIFCGKIIYDKGGRLFLSKASVVTKDISARFMPIYASKYRIEGSKYCKVLKALKHYDVEELFTDEILSSNGLLNINKAFQYLHWPQSSDEDLFNRRRILAFYRLEIEETLAHFAHSLKAGKNETLKPDFIQIIINNEMHDLFIKNLPFKLTKAQQNSIEDIFQDYQINKKPMMRLIQGDVGSGKTIVIAAAILQASLNSVQSVLLVPTTILAEQHKNTLETLFKPFDIKIIKICGVSTTKQINEINLIIKNNNNCVIIGTQSTFSTRIKYVNPGLAIIDEQHRFGVITRNALVAKLKVNGNTPHIILLTATPIPRTLAIANYGHIEISIIDELPPNRKPIKTLIMSDDSKISLIESLKSLIHNDKTQIYWVCSSIYPNEAIGSIGVINTYETIKEQLGSVANIGILHGDLSNILIDNTLKAFKEHNLDILVSTTIIEVGVNVPNATVMIVEDAHNFGLAQIHQLRGRVGRGDEQSYCILLYKSTCEAKARTRLSILKNNDNGIKLAELDLQMRGPGNLLGKQQKGLGKWKVAHWVKSVEYLEIVKHIYKQIDENTINKIISRWIDDESN